MKPVAPVTNTFSIAELPSVIQLNIEAEETIPDDVRAFMNRFASENRFLSNALHILKGIRQTAP